MKDAALTLAAKGQSGPAKPGGLLTTQQRCACGGSGGLSGECEECRKKRLTGQGGGSSSPLELGAALETGTSGPGHDFGRISVHSQQNAYGRGAPEEETEEGAEEEEAETEGEEEEPPCCPSTVDYSANYFEPNKHPAHVPDCGASPIRASSDVDCITWSLAPNPTAVDAGTTIAANGTITISDAQAAGTIRVVATGPSGCTAFRPLHLRSHPTGITSTRVVSAAGGSDYGAAFDHVLTSNDGDVASLAGVAVGERFPGIPNPTAATHDLTAPLYPFGGTFTLHTATLEPDASNNWFVTSAGELGGNHDNVTIGRDGVNVGRFVASHSNPTPPQSLPAGFSINQNLRWFCAQRPAASRWRPSFATVAHDRRLKEDAGALKFVTTVNGVEHEDDYTGPTAVFGLTANPASVAKSAPAPATPSTVRVTARTLPTALPSGETLSFTIEGNDLGSAIAADPADDHAAILTVGTTAGTVTVQAADTTDTNRDRVQVTVT